jgi:hypothetical protein
MTIISQRIDLMQLTQRVLDYDKYLSESEYLDELASSVAVEELFTAVVELLQSSVVETLSITLCFVQDLILWSPGEERQAAKASYPESIVVKAVEALLWSEHHRIRQQAGYVLGKTCSYSSIPVMTDAFHQWCDRDPLMLPFFMGELAWLGAENFHELVGRMISSPCFTTRWAAIDCLARFRTSRRQQQQRWDYLRYDQHELVRMEAEYEYRVQLFRLRGHQEFHREPPFRLTERREAIDRTHEPAVIFSNIKNRFELDLSSKGLSDYTIEQLEAFIEEYVAKGIT